MKIFQIEIFQVKLSSNFHKFHHMTKKKRFQYSINYMMMNDINNDEIEIEIELLILRWREEE